VASTHDTALLLYMAIQLGCSNIPSATLHDIACTEDCNDDVALLVGIITRAYVYLSVE